MRNVLLVIGLIFALAAGRSAEAAVYDLERIINRALEAGWSMRDARDDTRRAALRLQIAESEFELKIYPGASVGFSGGDDLDTETDLTLGIRLSKRTAYGTQIDLSPTVQRIDDQYQSQADLRIVQPLLRGAGRDYTLSSVYSARYGERVSWRSRLLTEINTVLTAVRYGYEVVRQREVLRLRQESYQRLLDLTEATAIKEGMGLATAMDLYRVRIQLNQAEEELNQSRENYQGALDNLKVFLALPLEETVDVTLPLNFDRAHPQVDAMIQTALTSRVELEQVRDELSEARRLADNARSDTLPDLDIGISLNMAGDPSSDFPGSTPDQTTWGVSLASSSDFRRMAEKAVYENSLITVQQVSRRQLILKDEITAEVKREIRNLERQDKAIATQEDQVHQARGQLALARIKFEHGLTDNFDLMDAENALRQAETQLVSAVIEYILGQFQLRKAIGTLIQRSDSGANVPAVVKPTSKMNDR